MSWRSFRATPRLCQSGDPQRCAALLPRARQELEAMRRDNVFDLPLYSRTLRLASGETVRCRRVGELEEVAIESVPGRRVTEAAEDVGALLPVGEGSFYAIPDCLARYDGASDLVNAIPDGDLAGWSLGLGSAVTVTTAAACGLVSPQGLPEAGITRERGVFVLPGGAASGLLFGRAHIPDGKPFSVSCLIRLREELAYDYTYDARGVYNPIRPYLVRSDDGTNWTWDCPGSISPVIGFCSPHRHPDWSAALTYPWAPWNADYAAASEHLAGVRRLSTACPDAPLLSGEAYVDATGQAYPHPCGFLMGLQAAGLFLYNGNRLLGARLSEFENQYGYVPALTDPLELGVWHHVVMTHAADGTVGLYLAREDEATGEVYSGNQPLCAMDEACAYQTSGVNAWTLANEDTGQAIGAYVMNPVMDISLPRFFHYALSAGQAALLQLEALRGLFVADDHEVGQAVAAGLSPIVIAKEDV